MAVADRPGCRRVRALPKLPVPPTSLVGRDGEHEAVLALLRHARLVTLTGPAGVGKTRLAMRAAAAAEPTDRARDVWLVDLSTTSTADELMAAIAAAIPDLASCEPDAVSVARTLGARPGLIVLDNCEHLQAACAAAVHSLLQLCPDLRVLATSQVSLQVPGERQWSVDPLPLPSQDRCDPGAGDSAAVRLFIERAQAACPGFVPDTETLKVVAEICTRLDGLPLAIELAASRVSDYSPDELLARVDDPFQLLTDLKPTAAPRHQSLGAAFEASYGLLPDASAILFARLGVFSGAWALESAEAIVALGSADGGSLVDVLGDLVARSLVVVARDGAITHYRLLDTVRTFARGKLAQRRELECLSERHASWYLARAEEAARHRGGPQPDQWLEALSAEHDELTAALRWARAHNRPDLGLALSGALCWYWESRGHLDEGLEWLRWSLEAATSADPALRARALRGAGILSWLRGDVAAAAPLIDEAVHLSGDDDGDDPETGCVCANVHQLCTDPRHAISALEADVARQRALNDGARLARALVNAGTARFFLSEAARATAYFDEALAVPRTVVEAEVLVDAFIGRGRAAVLTGDLGAAEAALGAALEVAQATRDDDGCATAYCWLGDVCRFRGDYAEARHRLANAAQHAATVGLPMALARGWQFQARLEAACGELKKARRLFTRSLTAPGSVAMPYHRARSLGGLAEIALAEGRLGDARRLTDQVIEVALASGDVQAQSQAIACQARVAGAAGDRDAAVHLVHEALQLQEQMGDVLGIIASLETLAELAAAAGRTTRAARLFGAAARAREACGCPRPHLEQRAGLVGSLAKVVQLRAARGWDKAVSEGSSLSPSEAIAFARRGRGTRTRAAAGWESLTPMEMEIAELVGELRTNREIGQRLLISHHTVCKHLEHVYLKLEVANRRELGRLVRWRTGYSSPPLCRAGSPARTA